MHIVSSGKSSKAIKRVPARGKPGTMRWWGWRTTTYASEVKITKVDGSTETQRALSPVELRAMYKKNLGNLDQRFH